MPWCVLESGRRLWYEERGEGAPLVLLHGWGMSSAVWRYQLQGLERDFRVLAPDLAGHGRSEPFAAVHDLAGLVADLNGFFRRLELTGALLAGWSLGSLVALAASAPLRERLLALALIAGTARFGSCDGYPHGQDPRQVAGMARRLRRDPAATLAGFRVGMFAEGECDEAAMGERVIPLLESLEAPDPRAARETLAILAESDLRPRLEGVELPTLIVNGDRDAICPPAASTYLAGRLSRPSRVVFEGCGHAPFLTRSHEFNAALTAFSRRMFERTR